MDKLEKIEKTFERVKTNRAILKSKLDDLIKKVEKKYGLKDIKSIEKELKTIGKELDDIEEKENSLIEIIEDKLSEIEEDE